MFLAWIRLYLVCESKKCLICSLVLAWGEYMRALLEVSSFSPPHKPQCHSLGTNLFIAWRDRLISRGILVRLRATRRSYLLLWLGGSFLFICRSCSMCIIICSGLRLLYSWMVCPVQRTISRLAFILVMFALCTTTRGYSAPYSRLCRGFRCLSSWIRLLVYFYDSIMSTAGCVCSFFLPYGRMLLCATYNVAWNCLFGSAGLSLSLILSGYIVMLIGVKCWLPLHMFALMSRFWFSQVLDRIARLTLDSTLLTAGWEGGFGDYISSIQVFHRCFHMRICCLALL